MAAIALFSKLSHLVLVPESSEIFATAGSVAVHFLAEVLVTVIEHLIINKTFPFYILKQLTFELSICAGFRHTLT